MNDLSKADLDTAAQDAIKARCRVAVLGAGPAGLAAAYRFAKREDASVEVFERAPGPGGNSGSFLMEGIWCDYGSHRFHPVAGPEILEDLHDLLGDDLLLRPRHGRIRLGGRWIKFPLKPGNALVKLPAWFGFSLLRDMVSKRFKTSARAETTFAGVMKAGLGQTICEHFYFPYVTKLWGIPPEDLDAELAHRRVSGNSVGRILRKMLSQLPGVRSPTAGRFYYPRRGFGQIMHAMADACEAEGVRFSYGAGISRITREGQKITGFDATIDGQDRRVSADQILSSIPLTTLVSLIDPPAEEAVRDAASRIRSRGMILIYLVLETDQFTEYDAHYFPELSIPVSRLSEPKNYSAATEPKGRTILCAELPSDPGSEHWGMDDDRLGAELVTWLGEVGLPVKVPVLKTITRRLPNAYPVYARGYADDFRTVDTWLSSLDGLVTFGRQGLFAHDNTHHAFATAYAVEACVRPDGSFDKETWAGHRKDFESHVVED
ncbi:NAD(P)/FAD-dependent oxidoreductase [Salipiger sp. PrR002]|uniref:protoporphyrinogen/coproporphyrinogen oxidase n=1 Tax=Salipiger sp. PrR002 TaxID=2706489 RepID=UPI0013B81CEE|nr:FAD-dependent oxidoreductase [Salipiger sp. PrR002]NDV99587.1 FAD-dependent oxidoreductase [Salipiger sp. PrR002]NDW57233.1 FAD-dependent oxidoreductase [Salipiger sp. PrR004]